MPARSGIGGLLARPGLQLWRWPVDETSVNVFLRWGGDQTARDCAGEVQVLDAQAYYCTPFHYEDGDKLEDDGKGTIRWQTTAEAGTGDGLNLWVRIDPRKPTRLRLTATRGGVQRPDEIFTNLGKVTSLPLEVPLTHFDAAKWVGEASLPALQPGEQRRVIVRWTPAELRTGKITAQLRPE